MLYCMVDVLFSLAPSTSRPNESSRIDKLQAELREYPRLHFQLPQSPEIEQLQL